ncbi:hypothetical protein [Microbacterium sp. NPDC089696]|uniref:hypothetical protein n=1 Tax=Microbacterium sp. NPDC089696 TaxID=3364199 RepID=UPI003810BBDD
MASGFKINKQAIRKMTREIEREFAKNPVRVPLQADASDVRLPAATTINNYHGPVVTVTGDGAQLAWDNHDVAQGQARFQQVATGYEELADLVTRLLAGVGTFKLDPADQAELVAAGEEILHEAVKDDPDRGLVRRGITMLKGVLAPIASGVAKAVSDETAEMARDLISSLGEALPS